MPFVHDSSLSDFIIGGGRKFGMGGGQNHRGSGDGSPPAESRCFVPQKLKNFKSSYKQILRIFGSISHIFIYICLCFFRACRHHSTKSAKWGAFDTVCPSCLQVGATAPCAPPPPTGSAAYGFYVTFFMNE